MPYINDDQNCAEVRYAQSVYAMCDYMKRALESFDSGQDLGVSVTLIRRINNTVLRLNQELTAAVPGNSAVRGMGQYVENASADLVPAIIRAASAVQLIRHDFWGLQRRITILEENQRALEIQLQRAEDEKAVLQETVDELTRVNDGKCSSCLLFPPLLTYLIRA